MEIDSDYTTIQIYFQLCRELGWPTDQQTELEGLVTPHIVLKMLDLFKNTIILLSNLGTYCIL